MRRLARFPLLPMLLAMLPALRCAAGPASAPTTQPAALIPYRAFAWIAPATRLPHVVGLVRFQSTSDPAAIAASLKRLATGERALLRWESNDQHFWHNPADQLIVPTSAASQPAAPRTAQGPWAAHGAAAEAAFETRFAAAVQRCGVAPDYLVLDTEMGVGTWSLTAAQLAAIEADPRWPPLARRFGVSGNAGLLHTGNTPNAQAFNLAMQVASANYFRAGYLAPWLARFPALRCSDFGDGVLGPSQAAQAIDDDGDIQPMSLPMHGNTQSPCCYAWVHKIAAPPASGGANLARPLPILCWITSMVRAYAQSPQPIVPWIGAKSWTDGHVPIINTPYQDELLWHVCLSAGCTDVLLFNPDARRSDDADVDADLAELQKRSGGSPTLAPLTTAAVPFASPVLVSGARCADGRRVYRVTVANAAPSPQAVSVKLPGENTVTAVTIAAAATGAWVVR